MTHSNLFKTGLVAACALALGACGGTPKPKTKPKKVVKPKPKPKPLPKTYEIRLHRPVKVGFHYELAVMGKRVTTITPKKGKPQQETWEYSYSATVYVKAVSERGKPTKEQHEVSSFILTKNGKPTKLPADPIIVGEIKNGKKAFKINGRRAKRGLSQVLRAIIDLDKGSPSADELYGTPKQHKVGESWDINKESVMKAFEGPFKNESLPLEMKNISGKVSLKEAADQDGVDKLHILVDMKIANAAPALGRAKPSAGSVAFSVDGWIAQDPEVTDFGNQTKKLVVHAETKRFNLDLVQEQTTKYTYPKPKAK